MKKKMLGIFVCMLLIATVLPAVEAAMNNNLIMNETSDGCDNLKEKISGCNLADWLEQEKLTIPSGKAYDYFGISVSLDGNYALIGAHGEDDSKGSAYIFKWNGASWVQEDKLTASDGVTDDSFGLSVSLDGDYALIGASEDDGRKGSAYVFKRDGTSWIQEDKLTASAGVAKDCFGSSVSLDGDYALIGAYGDDSYKGSVYVFKRDGTSWMQEEKLNVSDGATWDIFGISVSLDGDHALIGSYRNDDAKGSAYMFKWNGTSWMQENKLTASDGAANDLFGISVSLDGNYALIGAYHDDSGKGSAYVFKKPIPDLDCLGSIGWTNVKPGDVVNGSFLIENIGNSGSELSWEIESYPEWGTWTSSPSNGAGLTPEMGTITITVEVVAPDEQNKNLTGVIIVVNSEDGSDYDIVPVYLSTPKSKSLYINSNPSSWLFDRFPNAFQVISYLMKI